MQIQLPRWDHKCSFDLRKVFESLGLQKTLNTTEDFNNIQPKMMITQAAQAANITVAEKGTIAAAVTQINGEATSAPPQPERTIDLRPAVPLPDRARGNRPAAVHGNGGRPPLLTGTLSQILQRKPGRSLSQ